MLSLRLLRPGRILSRLLPDDVIFQEKQDGGGEFWFAGIAGSIR